MVDYILSPLGLIALGMSLSITLFGVFRNNRTVSAIGAILMFAVATTPFVIDVPLDKQMEQSTEH